MFLFLQALFCSWPPILVYAELVINTKTSSRQNGSFPSVPLDISPLRDNKAFTQEPSDLDFDSYIYSREYLAQYLLAENFVYSSIDFNFLLSIHTELVIDLKKSPRQNGGILSVPLDIAPLRNNRAFAQEPRDTDFDSYSRAYLVQYLLAKKLVYGSVDFIFLQYQPGSGFDNMLARGQILDIPPGRYLAVYILVAIDSALVLTNLTGHYSNSSNATSRLIVFPQQSQPLAFSPQYYAGDLVFPFHFTNYTRDFNKSSIYRIVNWLDSAKDLHQVQLPNVVSRATNRLGSIA